MEKIKAFLKSKTGKVIALLSLLIVVMLGYLLTFQFIIKKPEDQNYIVDENNSDQNISKIAGMIAIADNDVTILETSDDNWATAEVGMTVREGYSVKTGDDSKAVIELDDGSAIRINENSEIKLYSLKSNMIIIDQISGQTYHRVEKNELREYIVTNATVSEDLKITSLGTAFDVDLGDTSTIRCIESKIKVHYSKNQPEELVEEGEELVIGDEEGEVKGIEGENLDNDWFEFNKEQDKDLEEDLGIFENDEAPKVTITSPVNNLETTEASVLVTGETEAGNSVKMKNGEDWYEVQNNNGKFEGSIVLNDGENTIYVKVYSPAGVRTMETIVVYKVDEETETPTPTTPPVTQTFRITSLSSPAAGKINVTWEMKGYSEMDGFKIVFSKNANPTYPNRSGDYYYYASGGSVRTASFTHDALQDGGTFHVRVCRYNGSCDIYTQDLTVSVQAVPEPEWGEPTLELTKTSQDDRTIGLSWTIDNGLSDLGFKLVWSTSSNPTYPQYQTSTNIKRFDLLAKIADFLKPKPVYATETEYKTWGFSYLSSPSARTATVVLDETSYAPGTYYFRVGRYRGGYCDYYSNEISVTIE